ncbi:MAG: hypothetical protein WEC16_00030 [Anaerolineales bacterium]
MSFEIYHQLGFRDSWNLQSIHDDNTADGIIISPRHMDSIKVRELPAEIRETAIFDPQFYIPSVPKKQLETYDFFPEIIANGFDTAKYLGAIALDSARKCIDYQRKNGFRYIVIPTRQVPGVPPSFIDEQQELFVDPFLQAIDEFHADKPVLLQLILNDNMIKDVEYSARILDWVTRLPRINGVYLITEVIRRSKQLKDIDFLYSLLKFIYSVTVLNKMELVAGYLNVEALLLSIASPTIVAMGSYENTRMFDVRNFEEGEDQVMRGPRPRVYSSKLLQLVDHNYLGSIQQSVRGKGDVFDANKYQAEMFSPNFNWHFQRPELYKHYFLVLSRQLRELSQVEGADRFFLVKSWLERSKAQYAQLDTIVFDADSDDSHINAWHTAANRFAKEQGWH